MVYSFSISRQAIRKGFEFRPCEGLREPLIFDFKQSDGKLYQNRKQGGYGADMRVLKSPYIASSSILMCQ